ncbi:hypothetical protein ACH4S8_02695 [Streptomyces sp. NPDC021080]
MKRTTHTAAPVRGAPIDPSGPKGTRGPAGITERVLHSPDD